MECGKTFFVFCYKNVYNETAFKMTQKTVCPDRNKRRTEMEKTDIKYRSYIQILKEELVPAMGCTEPIALAYAAAKARETLGCLPDAVYIGVSGSIIKLSLIHI